MLTRLRDWLRRRHAVAVSPSALSITYDSAGFNVAPALASSQPQHLRVAWADVQKVGVFKRDLAIVDMLCLVVELPGPSTVELNEEMVGWQGFVEALPHFLTGAKPFHEWFMEVAFPAFETKPTLVFSRAALGAAPK